MGNLFECLGKNQPASGVIIEQETSFNSTQSITNYSLPSNIGNSSDTAEQDSIATNASYRFSWYRLQSSYLDTLSNNTLIVHLQPAVLEVMKKIFNDINNNIGLMSRTFYDCLIEMDKTFPVHFEEYAAQNPKSITQGKVLVERIRSHIIGTIQIHSIIINNLLNGDDQEVDQILNLIAISHMLMKVDPTFFNLLDRVRIKFLLRAGILCDDNAEAVVIYLNFLTRRILNYMKLHAAEENPNSIGFSKKARENYRQLKKWYIFLEDLRKKANECKYLDSHFKMTAADVDRTPSETTIPTQILKQETCLYKFFHKNDKNAVD